MPRLTRSQRSSSANVDLIAVGGWEHARVEAPAALCTSRASSGSATRVSMDALEGFDRSVGRGSHAPNDANGGELLAPAVRGGLGDPLVDVVGEELERSFLAVLLTHEQHRSEWREQGAERRERPRLRRASCRQRRDCRPGRDSVRRRRTVRAARPRPGRRRAAGGPPSSRRRRRTAVARPSRDPRSCRNRRNNPLAHR